MKKILILVCLMLLPTVYGAELTEKFKEEYNTLGTSFGSAVSTTVDFNSDGKLDGLAIVDNSGGRAIALNFMGGVRWSSPLLRGTTSGMIISADLDGDGHVSDTIAGAKDVYAFDSNGGQKWTFSPYGSVYSLATADLNGDGKSNEVIVGGGSNRLYALDSDGTKRWEITWMLGNTESVAGVDSNADGIPENIAVGAGKNVYLLDQKGNLIWGKLMADVVYSVVAADLDGDGYLTDVVAGAGGDGNVSAFNNSGNYRWTYRAYLSSGQRIKLIASDLKSRGKFDHVVVKADAVHALDSYGSLAWPQTFPGVTVSTIDFNGDGKYEGVISGTASYIYAISSAGQQVGFYTLQNGKETKSPYNKTGADIVISAADIDGDGFLDDVIGIGGGIIFSLDHTSLAPAPTLPPVTTQPPTTAPPEIKDVTVKAGKDQTVTPNTLVTLEAEATPSVSTGKIVTYLWTEGSTILGESKTLGKIFEVGEHTITIKVRDNEGKEASDTVMVTVSQPVTTPPVTTPAPAESTTSPIFYIVLGIIIGMLIVAGVVVYLTGKKKEGEWAK